MASYQTVTRDDTRELTRFLFKNGQLLLPMVQLIEQSRCALDELLDATGRSVIELILRVSAAASLREGLGEMFTISRMNLPPTLSDTSPCGRFVPQHQLPRRLTQHLHG